MSELLASVDIKPVAVVGLVVALAIAGYGLLNMKVKEPSRAVEKAAQQVGGMESLQDLKDYIMCDTLNYCDKGGHKERSRKNDPNHEDYWKKQK